MYFLNGGELVTIDRSVESTMMDELLSDDSVYKREDKDDTESKREQLNRTLREVIVIRNLRGMNGFTRGPLRIPVMYTMVKTHKMQIVSITTTTANLLNCRPIISAVNGPAYRISRLLATIRRADFMGSHVMSFDFESLYTNVDNEAAVRAP
ncbi:hypothetical protein ACOME3_004716 [Neoechinorhynchus agilis]